MVCQKLIKFLNNYPKTENGKHTHIIYAPSPGKSYTIPDDKIEESPDDSKFNTEKHHKRQHKF